jgi:hypothetical protein
LQYGDINGLLSNRTAGATLYGADQQEKNTVLLGKLAHYTLLAGLPLLLHGPQAALIGAAAYTLTQSIVLSATFAVSHNVPESKPLEEGPTQVRWTEYCSPDAKTHCVWHIRHDAHATGSGGMLHMSRKTA